MIRWIRKKRPGAWTARLSVGNAVIDSEHRNLLDMLGHIELLLDKADLHALGEAFEQMEHWLCVHFSNENHIVQSVNHDFTKHRLEQQSLLEDLRSLKSEMTIRNGQYSKDEVQRHTACLKDRLIGHILESDMAMKEVLQSLPYDFLPEKSISRCECGHKF